jgi:hypothetical protein
MADVTAVLIISWSRSLRDLRRLQKKKPRMMQIMREPPAVPAPMPAWAPVLRPLVTGTWVEVLPPALLSLPLPLPLPLPPPPPPVKLAVIMLLSVVVTPLDKTVVMTLLIVIRSWGVVVVVDVTVVVFFAFTTEVIVDQ